MKNLRGRLLLAVAMVAFVAACATTQSHWEAAKSADTLSAYDDFLKEYPEGDLAHYARVRRDELQEERDWKTAEAKNTVAVYEDFKQKYPRGRHENDVHARLQKLSLPEVNYLPLLRTEKSLPQYEKGVFLDEALSTREKPSLKQTQAEDILPNDDGHLNRYPGALGDEDRLRQEKLNAVSPVTDWGTIMYPKPNTNIRAKRSVSSKLKGQLKTGQPVKADFLQDGWYAVFPVSQKQRNEKIALGYVYAPLLMDNREPNSSKSKVSEEKPAKDTPLKKTEAESLAVDVKNIIFKVAGDGKELLFIEFDRFYTPAISAIEGKEPRIILEIKNSSPLRGDWEAINTGGHLIWQIRSSMDSQTRAALIVLDMTPEKDYFVSQTFYRKENMYSLEISDKKGIRLP